MGPVYRPSERHRSGFRIPTSVTKAGKGNKNPLKPVSGSYSPGQRAGKQIIYSNTSQTPTAAVRALGRDIVASRGIPECSIIRVTGNAPLTISWLIIHRGVVFGHAFIRSHEQLPHALHNVRAPAECSIFLRVYIGCGKRDFLVVSTVSSAPAPIIFGSSC